MRSSQELTGLYRVNTPPRPNAGGGILGILGCAVALPVQCGEHEGDGHEVIGLHIRELGLCNRLTDWSTLYD